MSLYTNDPKTQQNNTERWRLMGNGYTSLQDPDKVVTCTCNTDTIQYNPSKLPKVIPNTHIPNWTGEDQHRRLEPS